MKTNLMLLIVSLFMLSCNKDEPLSSGENGIRYEAKEYTDLAEDVTVGIGRIYVENVSPYEDMVGSIMSSALDGTTNGNDERISDVSITDVAFSLIELRIYSEEADTLERYLKDIKLILGAESDPYGIKEVASFSDIDRSNNIITFDANTEDLTSWIKEARPSQMYFDYEFNYLTVPKGPIHLKYEVIMDFNYAYESSEDKN